MWIVLESAKVLKQIKKCPKEIVLQYEAWKKIIELGGPQSLRAIPGFNDHHLKGKWSGARSSYLNIQWRVIYSVSSSSIQVRVLEVTPHDYR